MTWISELVSERSELETPSSFYYWAGLATISAVVKDQVWLPLQLYNLYPNIFVMLHARSGLKKGPAVAMAREMVTKVNNTRIISGRSSIQGILTDLREAYTQPGGNVINKAVAFICASELSSSLVEDKAAMNILTDLYDRQYYEDNWGHRLRDQKFNLKKPTITMLTATNQAHSDEIFQKKDIQGGYIARTFIIYADEDNAVNSLVYPLSKQPDNVKAVEYLKKLSKLQGPFKPLFHEGKITEAGEYYDNWYRTVLKPLQRESEDETGTLNRFGDSVLKIAMLLSLSRSVELEINLDDIQEAIGQCEKLIGHTRRVTLGKTGKSNFANQKVKILEILLERNNHMISRKQLYHQMQYHLNPSELDEIMHGFDITGVIKTENHGKEMVYVMPEDKVQAMLEFMRGRKKK